ncbi:periplasmic binding protein [Salinisphaera sp. T31B1]
MPGVLHRLAVLLVGLTVLAGPVVVAAAANGETGQDAAPPRVAAIDWGQAQTLTALGVPPVAAAQTDSYNIWVGAPKLDAATRELGLRAQPNMELLSQLDLDLITITSMYASAEPRLSQIAPVKSIDIYQRSGDVWTNTLAATRELAAAVGRPAAAERLIEKTQRQIARYARQLDGDTPPLLVVQFMDARHVRVYGQRSLIDSTIEQMGLTNAWQQPTLMWGFALVPIQRLAAIDDALMVVMGPIPVGVEAELADSVVWQSLPTVRRGALVHIPGVWSYGGLPSTTRFARLIVAALADYAGPATADAADSASASSAS